MADRGEDDASPAEIVCPARDSLGTQVFTFADVSQTVDVLTPQDDVFGVSIIVNEVLLVVHHEILNTSRDRVVPVHDRHLERTQRRMIDVCSAHHLTIVPGEKRDMAAVMERVEPAPG